MSFNSLPDDLQFEIFRRLPPSPQFLVRAAAVCKEWQLIPISPVHCTIVHVGDPVSFSFDSDDGSTSDWKFLDCRHGRVLLGSSNWRKFLVWHPMTGERHLISTVGQLDHVDEDKHYYVYGTALLCDCVKGHAAGETSPYRVAVIFSPSWSVPDGLFATVFSSLTGQ